MNLSSRNIYNNLFTIASSIYSNLLVLGTLPSMFAFKMRNNISAHILFLLNLSQLFSKILFYLKTLCIGTAYPLSEISFVFTPGVGFSVKQVKPNSHGRVLEASM